MRLVAMFGSTPSRFPLSQPMLSHFHDESLYSLYSSVLLSFFLFQQNYNIFLRDILKTDSHVFFSHFRKSQKKFLDFSRTFILSELYERPDTNALDYSLISHHRRYHPFSSRERILLLLL